MGVSLPLSKCEKLVAEFGREILKREGVDAVGGATRAVASEDQRSAHKVSQRFDGAQPSEIGVVKPGRRGDIDGPVPISGSDQQIDFSGLAGPIGELRVEPSGRCLGAYRVQHQPLEERASFLVRQKERSSEPEDLGGEGRSN